MSLSKTEILKILSDYQVQLLILLQRGYYIVTNEGANFQAWLEDPYSNCISFRVRKDSVDILYSRGLLEGVGHDPRKFYYSISQKGKEVLALVKPNIVDFNARRIDQMLHNTEQ